jgi:hypothetical protein
MSCGHFRFWHLADIDLSANVRFAPTADVATKFRCLILCKVKMSLGGFNPFIIGEFVAHDSTSSLGA